MNIIKKGFKREYIKPSIVMFAMSNEEYLLAASPNVRPGGGGNPPGSVTIEPLVPVDGGDDDNLEG
ncbi:MAG: hypothetical protein HXO07_00005 [Prevotella salivae]|uniref:hypothetical protein n=1 Tax=Segatella salivae TaxID=228604 RepID=UPI001CB2EF4D|nr:hypothetical protein [Segatella salivae]MBF1535813.1 hypothetical protein [Segatella salivae]MBF1552075.1 hypothetical protein [Segatella salivae]MBF1556884.1 hypothetical protein [Segatella salivae]